MNIKQDRFLIGILAFIALLVIVSVALFLVRRGAPAYVPEDTPQGVLHNYASALLFEDYERAYGYLAEADNKPTLEVFRQAFLSRQLDVSGSGIQIDKVENVTTEQARIELTVVYYDSGEVPTRISDSNQTAILVRQNGTWRISSMPYPYWSWNWYQPEPVR